MNEFSLIQQFFKSIAATKTSVLVGIGDDAACLSIPNNKTLLVSTDTLVSGVHFLPEWDAYDIASKAVLVNVSDMAAMAAEPQWITLALTLPDVNEPWLQAFANGLKNRLTQFNIDLVGGDTTRGPLSITITIMGLAPPDQVVLRSGAKQGDIILVSGRLGGAALALKLINQSLPAENRIELMNKLHHPRARVDLIPFLRKYATAAIDISDGLSADLNHICVASGVGATIFQNKLPLHTLLNTYCPDEAIDLALRGGDDYELCFTVPFELVDDLMYDLKTADMACFPIGMIEAQSGLRMQLPDGGFESIRPRGYTHF
ncbi:MAG: thiamine-phosphate kinase [Legionella sp.]|nr:thiamine-phosphate kinase [Legionella sp.]